MKKTILSLFFVSLFSFTFSQFNEGSFQNNSNIVRCATDTYMDMMFDKYPDYKERRKQIKKETEKWLKANAADLSNNKNVITIPVVVHILYYHDHPAFNLPASRVQEQMDVLNEDFRRLNPDASQTPSVFQSVAADAQIEFCLAKRTPSGAYTDGIVRVHTDVAQFSIGNAMKFSAQGGSDAWDRSRYLNIWVCNLDGSALGFAQMPGGPPSTDGIVIHYSNFGTSGINPPYNGGRTATHEVGHWLDLHHIWGDDAPGACTGTDYCNDTPTQADPYFGCPNFPQSSCGSTDMFMNFMDYTYDACMNIFTNNQKGRMWAALHGPRNSIRTSNGCEPGHGAGFDEQSEEIHAVSLYPNPCDNLLNISLQMALRQDVTLNIYNSLGQQVYTMSFTQTRSIDKIMDLSDLNAGIYYVHISAENFVLKRKITRL